MSEQSLLPSEAPAGHTFRCDRRAWVRYACERDASCQRLPQRSGVFYPARVENISASGVCLTLHHRLKEGTLLALTIAGSAGCSQTLVVRIVRLAVLTASPGLSWSAGCEFVQPLDGAKLTAILG